MTSAAVPTRAVRSAKPVPPAAPALLNGERTLLIGLFTAAVVWAFWGFFYRQHLFSSHGQDWTHAYMVPLISGYLLWQNRAAVLATKPTVFWPGLIPLAMSVPCYLLFQLGSLSTHMGQGWAMILAVFGLCLLLMGPRMMQHLFLPIAYLALGVTIAEMVMIKVTFTLQGIAAQGGWVMLNLLGVTTDIDGNQLTVWAKDGSAIPLNIAQACSGMRMVIAFAALSVAVALVGLKHWWQRIALMMCGIPVAVFMNMVRVAVLGVGSLYDTNIAQGEAHMFIGYILLVVAFFMFMGIAWLLGKLVHEAPEKGGVKPVLFKGGPLRMTGLGRPAFIVSLGVLLVSAVGMTAATTVLGVHLKKMPIQAPGNRNVASIPTETENWVTIGPSNVSLKKEFVEELGTSNYLSRTYQQRKGADGKPGAVVQLHLAYYTGMVDTVPHVPDRCMTASGMMPVTLSERLPIALERGTWIIDEKATGSTQPPVFTARTSRFSDVPNSRVRLPRGVDTLEGSFSTFDIGSQGKSVAGYFFIANGGVTPTPEGVRILAFKLQDEYAYYLKVQTTISGNVDSAECARLTGLLLSELLPDITRTVPDWTEVESGAYPPDNPRKDRK